MTRINGLGARHYLLAAIVVLAGTALFWVVYRTTGPAMICAIYRGESGALTNHLIPRRDQLPLSYYLDKSDRLARRVSITALFVALTLIWPQPRRTFIVARPIFLVSLIGLFAALIFPTIRFTSSPDTSNFLSCAEHVLHGGGFVSTGFGEAAFEESVRKGGAVITRVSPRPVPYTHWPPLYPLAVAGMMALTHANASTAATWLNGFLLAAFLILFCRALVPALTPELFSAGLLATYLLILLPSIEGAFSYLGPELLFVVICLGTLLILQRFVDSLEGVPWKRWATLAMCASLTSLALLTKYVGVTMLAMGLLAIWMQPWCRKRGGVFQKAIQTGFFCALAIGPIVPWLIRNRRLTGFWSGGNRPPGSGDILGELLRVIHASAKDLLLTDRKVIWVAMLFACLAVLNYVWRTSSISLGHFFRRYSLCVVYPCLHGVTLAVLRSTFFFEDIGTRLMFPAYPFVLLIGVAFLISGLGDVATRLSSRCRVS